MTADHPLDNVVWHALTGPHTDYSEAPPSGGFRRYEPDVCIFGAVDELTDEGWQATAELIGSGGVAVFFRDVVPQAPVGWEELGRFVARQMVMSTPAVAVEDAVAAHDLVELDEADVAEMLALTKLTEPGPFGPRTHELGPYHGVREHGQLIAMAGNRFQAGSWTEVSGVCVHPGHRGKGLGAALTMAAVGGAHARSDEAFLHVLDSNQGAISVYEALGFEHRRDADVVAVRWLGESS